MRLAIVAVLSLAAACASANVGGGDGGDDDDRPDARRVDAPPITVTDAGPPDAVANCSLVPQSGCPMGQSCDLDGDRLSTGGTICRMTGTGRDSNECTLDTDCAAGYSCIGSTTAASCMELCRTDADCTAPGGLCLIEIVDGAGNTIPGPGPGGKVVVCTQNCDVVTSSGCPAAWGCHPYLDGTRGLTACTEAGGSGQGASCTNDTSCLAGYSCYNTGTAMQCLKNCRIGAGGCPGGTSCGSLNPPFVLGGTEYGACG